MTRNHQAIDPILLLSQELMESNYERKLTLRNIHITSMLAAQSLAAGIMHAKVEVLKIKNDMKETTEAGEASGSYLRILHDCIRSSPTINWIILEEFYASELNDYASVLCSMHSLCYLTIEYFSGSFGRKLFLADVLIRQPSLVMLKVRSGTLEHSDVRRLAQGLHQNRSLKTLELRSCEIDDQDVGYLMEYWPHDSPLKRMYLPENHIGPAGVQSLLPAAQEHPALREINLGGNRGIGYEGARLIGNALPNLQHITHLDITDIIRFREFGEPPLDPSSPQAQTKVQAELALMNGTIRNNGIFELLFCKDFFSHALQDGIRLYTELNNLGRYLLTADHELPPTVWCHIFGKSGMLEGIKEFGRIRTFENRGFEALRMEKRQKYFDKGKIASVIYFFLREQPQLAQPR